MDDRYLDAFIRESEEAITELNNSLLELETDSDDRAGMESTLRTVHTLKGNFGAMGFEEASNLAHALEDLLDEIRDGSVAVTPRIMDLAFAGVDEMEAIVREIDETGDATVDTAATIEEIRAALAAEPEGSSSGDTFVDPGSPSGDTSVDPGSPSGDTSVDPGSSSGDIFVDPGSSSGDIYVDEIKSVSVDVDRIEDLHGLVEQLVTSRIELRRAVERERIDSASESLSELDEVTANLQNTVMDMQLIPLKKVVGKFPRLVRDLARDLDKEVAFEIEGEDIELDRTILTEISDPLMHVLRNAVDHGIEPPAERERLGKPRTGHVELSAARERDHVFIEVTDDGGGLDAERIEQQALERGIRSSDELELMTDAEIYDLVFHPGVSTAEEVTDTSGRGVGMDVVRETVTELDGSVTVESTPGEGTTVSLCLPVTLAIVAVLVVRVGDEQYGIPVADVEGIASARDARRTDGNEVLEHDGDVYPVVHLADALDVPGDATGEGTLVRIRESERTVALHCDAVTGRAEVVVEPLEGVPGAVSGTAVLDDGTIVHVLDVTTL